jgi:chemotaxis protein MotB
MAEESNAPIIVKRVKKKHHDAHHGGAWKVAYADFVTAMMAFFLLLWLLNATTEDQRKGIAEYFSPVPGAVGETTGGNGFFGGQTVTTEGPMVESNAPVSVTIPIPTTSFDQEKTEGTEEQQAAKGKDDQGKEPDASDPDKAQKLLEELENKQFKEAEQQLRQAIQKIPDIKELAENLIIDQTPEGLRIQLVDQDKNSMFPRGGTTMTDKARILMHQVAKVITKLPQKIAISGHTDSTPYANANGYDNWDLSTDRANASRRALIEAGLNPERIVNLAGKAETEPFIKDDPTSPQNRRISIVLLREKAAQNAAAGGGAPSGDKDTDKSVATPPKPKT